MQWPEAALLAVASAHVAVVVYETDVLLRRDGVVNWWCSCLSFILLILYTCELVARIRTHCKVVMTCPEKLPAFPHTCLYTSPWHFLDAAVIAVDAVNEVVGLAMGTMPARPLLLMLRILRVLRPLRTLALAPALSGLKGRLSRAAEVAAWGTLFLVMLVTVWAIIAVEVLHPLNVSIAQSGAYDDCHWCTNAFQSVAEANLTLMRHIVMGDGWESVVLVIIDRHPWTAAIFLLAFASINLGLLSLIVATMVGRTQETLAAPDKKGVVEGEGCDSEATLTLLLKVCAELDIDGTGMTIEKVVQGFERSAELRIFLRRLGIGRDDLQCIFAILDEEAAGVVSHRMFAEQLLRMQARSNDGLLMFIRLHFGKAQQKFEEQLIWFEQRRPVASSPKDATPEKKGLPFWDTELSALQAGLAKKPSVVRTVTPFATSNLSECHSSGSLNKEAMLSLGEVGRPKQKFFGDLPEEKMQTDSSGIARTLPSVPGSSITNELDLLRRHIDSQLEALSREFGRSGVQESSRRGEDDRAMSVGSVDRGTSQCSLPMPSPDIALTPPPVGWLSQPLTPPPAVISRRRGGSPISSGRRTGSPAAGRRGSKGVVLSLSLPPPGEEEPISGTPVSWRMSLQQASGISCCDTQQASKKHRLVTVESAR